MAYSLALKRAPASSLFCKILNPIRSACVARRFFGSNDAQMTTVKDDRRVDVDRRSDRSVSGRGDSVPAFFSDVWDPFSPTRSLSQMLNLVDQLMDIHPIAAAAAASPRRGGWDVKEDNEALYMRLDMPGVDKEEVKICVENNTLIIKGEGEKDSEDSEEVRRYSSRLDLLPRNLYKVDEIKAEMKNGVLKIKVPKVREEERTDVYEVRIE